MDYMLGGDLGYQLSKLGQMAEHDVMMYSLEIGSALEYLRGQRIIHRSVCLCVCLSLVGQTL